MCRHQKGGVIVKTMYLIVALLAFNGYDSCTHGENMEPWNLWSDLIDSECKARTQEYVHDIYDRLERLCSNKRVEAARKLSHLFASDMVRFLRKEQTCERAAASIRHQKTEDLGDLGSEGDYGRNFSKK